MNRIDLASLSGRIVIAETLRKRVFTRRSEDRFLRQGNDRRSAAVNRHAALRSVGVATPMQPLLRSLGSIPIGGDFCLELRDPIL